MLAILRLVLTLAVAGSQSGAGAGSQSQAGVGSQSDAGDWPGSQDVATGVGAGVQSGAGGQTGVWDAGVEANMGLVTGHSCCSRPSIVVTIPYKIIVFSHHRGLRGQTLMQMNLRQ